MFVFDLVSSSDFEEKNDKLDELTDTLGEMILADEMLNGFIS